LPENPKQPRYLSEYNKPVNRKIKSREIGGFFSIISFLSSFLPSKKSKLNSAIGALLHGIHPMHVESVSWISERKDLMYFFFYFIALIMYVRHIEGVKFKWMLYLNICLAVVCLMGIIGLKDFSLDFLVKGHNVSINDSVIFSVLFILLAAAIVVEFKFKKIELGLFYVMEFFLFSLLSKPMAVSFPLSILVIDFLLKRDLQFISQGKSWIYNQFQALIHLAKEKWMFFLVVFLSGLQTILIQVGVNSLVFTNGYTVTQKFLIACYTFTMYTIKAFYPTNLCSYYPFPNLTYEHYLPSIFYVMPLFAIAIVVIPIFLARKNKDLLRIVLFGLGFYFVNIVFFLQFISSGKTIISDRYSYVAYFGIVFTVIYLIHWYWYKSKAYHIVIQGLLAVVCVTLGYLCYERTKVWHNAGTLWTDVAAKNGLEVDLPYFNLGNYYTDSGKYDKAYANYVVLLKLKTKEPLVFRNLAMIYGMRKQFDSSFYCFAKALQYDSTDATIYNNRGITYANLGKFDLAVKDLTKAYSMDTSQENALVIKASILSRLGRYSDAIIDYNKLISKKPKESSYYLLRGNNYLGGGNAELAIHDYLHLLELQPNNNECMYYLSAAYHVLKNNANAVKYATMAQAAGYKMPDGYMNTLK